MNHGIGIRIHVSPVLTVRPQTT